MRVLFHLNNSLTNKCFKFKIPSQNIYTIIPFPTCTSMEYLKPIVLEFYHVLAQRVGTWLIIWPIFLTFQLSSLIFFNNILYVTWTTPSFNCKYPSMLCTHPINLMGIPFTLPSWQWTHWSPWWSSQHLCQHCTKCWLPHGTKTITCAYFNHIQFILPTNWHCAHQRWHSHPKLKFSSSTQCEQIYFTILHN
jgi:hypothetical protein